MLHRTLKVAWFNRGRYALTIVAIALSVAFIVATLLLTFSISNVAEPLDAAYSGTAAVIQGEEITEGRGPAGMTIRPSVPTGLVDELTAAGLEAVGDPGATARILDSAGDPAGQTATANNPAVAWLGDSPLNLYSITEGTPPGNPTEMALDSSSAAEANLAIGDTVTLVSDLGVSELTLVGLASFGETDGAPYATTTILSPDHPILTPVDGLATVNVADAPDVMDRVREITADTGLVVLSGDDFVAQETDDLESVLGFFTVFLTIFAVIAVVVGAVIVANTFTVSIAQRISELALFRLIGSTQRQIMGQVLIEAVVLGLVGTLIGLVGGIYASGLLDRVLERAGLSIERSDSISPTALAIGAAVGLGVTVFSSVRPALKASAVPPIEALRSVDGVPDGPSRVRRIGAIILGVIGLALIVLGVKREVIGLVGLALAILFASLIVGTPLLIRLTARAAQPLLSKLGPPGLLVSRNLSMNATRTAAAAMALMIGISLVSFFTLMAATISDFSVGGADEYLTADYVVSALGDFPEPALTPDLVTRLGDLDGVTEAAPVVLMSAASDATVREGVSIGVAPLDALSTMIDFEPIDGDPTTAGDNRVLVQSELADNLSLVPGDEISVRTQAGPLTLEVAAVVANTLPGGPTSPNILLDSAYTEGLDGPSNASWLFLAGDGVTEADVDAAVASPTIDAASRDDYLANLTSGLISFIGLIYALLAIALIIALVGVANTVSLSISERAGEIAAMRAAGATRTQVFVSLVAEFSLLAVVGVATGMVFALVAATTFFRAMSEGQISVPNVSLTTGVLILVLGLGAGALASVWPARTAANRDILDVLRSE